MNAVELESLTKRYGRRAAVKNLNLTVPEGEVFGLLGRNGAGKSTTIKMMLGLVRPNSGTVRLFGHDLVQAHDRALERVGSLVERPAFYSYLTGRQNLEILAQGAGTEFRRRAEELAERLSIASRLDDPVKAYSQGMRQKLGIILSLLPDSELVILDEPTNGLDPHGIREVRQFIQEMGRTRDRTIFLSSHLLSEVEQVCTRLAVLEEGERISQGTLSELLGTGDEIIVSTDRPEEAGRLLESWNGCTVTAIPPDSLKVTLHAMEPAELNARLVQAGFRVRELRSVRRTLEEYFLHLTQGSNDSDAQD